VPEDVTHNSLGGYLIPGIKGRGVCKGEGNKLMQAIFREV
jgi:hypothetical protein